MMTKYLLLLSLTTLPVPAAMAEWAESLSPGSPLPPIEATDQFGKTWTAEALAGQNGLLFLFNRSTGW